MKLTCILRVTAQFIITDVSAISWGQFQNSQLRLSSPSFKIQKGSGNLSFTVSISLDAENMENEGYRSILQDLIRFLKDVRKCWVKQKEIFILTLLNKVVAFPFESYHLKKSGDHNDIEAHVFEVLLYVVSCSECLSNFCQKCRIFHLVVTYFVIIA